MKKILIILALMLGAVTAKAQWTLQAYGEYDYTRSSGSSAAFAVKGDCRMADNFNLGLGLQATTF